MDIEAAMAIQQSAINNLLGKPVTDPLSVKGKLESGLAEYRDDTLFATALNQRNEMIMSRRREYLANLHYEAIKTLNKPVISVQLTGGGKNGFMPDLNKVMPN